MLSGPRRDSFAACHDQPARPPAQYQQLGRPPGEALREDKLCPAGTPDQPPLPLLVMI
jgi:hypothetical protein